jgi:hypothetical protein
VPGGQEGVDARGLGHGVAHGNVLHHLALAALDGRAHDDAAAISVIQEWEDLLAHKVGEVCPLLLKDGDGPRLLRRGHLELRGGVKNHQVECRSSIFYKCIASTKSSFVSDGALFPKK